MFKALLVFGVAIGILLAAAQFMRQHHTSEPMPAGPVQVNVTVPNPLGGSPSGGGDRILVP